MRVYKKLLIKRLKEILSFNNHKDYDISYESMKIRELIGAIKHELSEIMKEIENYRTLLEISENYIIGRTAGPFMNSISETIIKILDLDKHDS